MDWALAKALCSQRVPNKCPFCAANGVDWDEFKVHLASVHYYNGTTRVLDGKIRDEEIYVFCTKCEEEIRPEDI